MTEEEYNLDLKAQQLERQQRVEQHLQTIEKSLKSTNTKITIFIVLYLCISALSFPITFLFIAITS